jgi:hypothetical protein
MNQNNEREISINMHRNNEIKCDSLQRKRSQEYTYEEYDDEDSN